MFDFSPLFSDLLVIFRTFYVDYYLRCPLFQTFQCSFYTRAKTRLKLAKIVLYVFACSGNRQKWSRSWFQRSNRELKFVGKVWPALMEYTIDVCVEKCSGYEWVLRCGPSRPTLSSIVLISLSAYPFPYQSPTRRTALIFLILAAFLL